MRIFTDFCVSENLNFHGSLFFFYCLHNIRTALLKQYFCRSDINNRDHLFSCTSLSIISMKGRILSQKSILSVSHTQVVSLKIYYNLGNEYFLIQQHWKDNFYLIPILEIIYLLTPSIVLLKYDRYTYCRQHYIHLDQDEIQQSSVQPTYDQPVHNVHLAPSTLYVQALLYNQYFVYYHQSSCQRYERILKYKSVNKYSVHL